MNTGYLTSIRMSHSLCRFSATLQLDPVRDGTGTDIMVMQPPIGHTCVDFVV
jgi:hypothetical protein